MCGVESNITLNFMEAILNFDLNFTINGQK